MMKINWPPNLIEELACRRCVIFIGSGISATSINASGQKPKTWSEFLDIAKSIIAGNDLYGDVETLISQNKYLLALQTIFDVSDSGRYIYLLESEFDRQNYLPSKVHNLINNIDAKIVITTNFDKIYEKTLANKDGYCVIKYNDSMSLCDQIRSDNRLIIKAHGDINDPQNIIFTRKQYFDAKESSYFYRH